MNDFVKLDFFCRGLTIITQPRVVFVYKYVTF